MKIDKDKLHIAMADACASSKDLQTKSKLSRGTYIGAISGKNCRPVTVGKIAKALDVPADKIIKKAGEVRE